MRSYLLAAALLVTPATLVEPPPFAEISTPATAEAPAVRIDPPATLAPVVGPPEFDGSSWAGRCIGAEVLLAYYSPGWDVVRMSRIMYRESRCQPGVRSGAGATGLLQMMPLHCRWLPADLGEPCSVERLRDPIYNVRAAAALFDRDGYRPWRLTS